MVPIWPMGSAWHVLLSVIYAPVQLHVSSVLLPTPRRYSTMLHATHRVPILLMLMEIPVFHATRLANFVRDQPTTARVVRVVTISMELLVRLRVPAVPSQAILPV